MASFIGRMLKGAACFGAIAGCLIAAPAARADTIVEAPHARVVVRPPLFRLGVRPVGWFGGRGDNRGWPIGPVGREGPRHFRHWHEGRGHIGRGGFR